MLKRKDIRFSLFYHILYLILFLIFESSYSTIKNKNKNKKENYLIEHINSTYSIVKKCDRNLEKCNLQMVKF